MAVGLTHTRGVNGVMPIESQESGHSKGLAVKRRGMSSVCHTLRWITSRWQYCPHISTGSEGMLQYSWQGPSEWHGWCAYTLSSDEWVLLKSRMREICKSGSERGVKFFYMAEYCDTLQSKEKRNREYKVCLNDRALRLLDHNVTLKSGCFPVLEIGGFGHCLYATRECDVTELCHLL